MFKTAHTDNHHSRMARRKRGEEVFSDEED